MSLHYAVFNAIIVCTISHHDYTCKYLRIEASAFDFFTGREMLQKVCLQLANFSVSAASVSSNPHLRPGKNEPQVDGKTRHVYWYFATSGPHTVCEREREMVYVYRCHNGLVIHTVWISNLRVH